MAGDALPDALLAVEPKVEHHDIKRCAQVRRRLAMRRRRKVRCRSLSLAKAPIKAEHVLPESQQAAEPVEPALPALPLEVAEAYGHELFQSGWDWPLSRLEKEDETLGVGS
eukprot:Skav208518  [mRNA]  locus=scaffold1322:189145:193048:+ [translate_table: standard]